MRLGYYFYTASACAAYVLVTLLLPAAAAPWATAAVALVGGVTALTRSRRGDGSLIIVALMLAGTLTMFSAYFVTIALTHSDDAALPFLAVGYFAAAVGLRNMGRPLSSKYMMVRFDIPIILVGALVIEWQVFLMPYVTDPTYRQGSIVQAVVPFFDVVLLCVFIRMMVSGAREVTSMRMILLAASSGVLSDLVTSYLGLKGEYAPGGHLDVLAGASYILFASATVHPTLERVGEPTFRPRSTAIQALWLLPLGVGVPIVVSFSPLWGNPQSEYVVPVLVTAFIFLFLSRMTSLMLRADKESLTDKLTGAANRRAFMQVLANRCEDRGGLDGVVIALVDLDRFKDVNDGKGGHAAGDAFLVEVIRRLTAAVRSGDLVARIGGDEIAVLLGTREPDLSSLGRRLSGCFLDDFVLPGATSKESASIGVVSGSLVDSMEELLVAADTAMYSAKEAGRDTFVVYDEALHRESRDQERLRRDLTEEVTHPTGQLVTHYQPICNLSTGEVRAYEALVRWKHPEMGLLTAGSFLHLLDRPHLQAALDEQVLQHALSAVEHWSHMNPEIAVCVNLSLPSTLRSDLAAVVLGHVRAAGVAPERLVLEITEHDEVQFTQSVLSNIQALTGAGVRFILDDFGRGYTNLDYLQRLSISAIKVDKSLVTEAAQRKDFTLLAGIVALANSLSMFVVAEGVETSEQESELRNLGISHGQGYHLGHPAPVTGLPSVLDL